MKKGILTGALVEKMCGKIKREIARAESFAKKSRFPETRELYEDVYWKG